MVANEPDEPARERRILRAVAELTGALTQDFDAVELLHRLLGHAVELLDADAGGVLLSDRGQLRVAASSSSDANALETFEMQSSEGPCYDAFRLGELITVGDLASSRDRWPRFVPLAEELGWHSAHGVPLRCGDEVIGAMNLFSGGRRPLARRDLDLATTLADLAAVAVVNHRITLDAQATVEQLQHALDSRVTIEHAKGRICERTGCDGQAAFDALRRYARARREKMTVAAQRLLDGHATVDEILEAAAAG